MSFKWTITCPPLMGEFETGSIAEAVGIIVDSKSELTKLFDAAKLAAVGDDEGNGNGEGDGTTSTTTATAADGKPAGKPRGRPRKGADPATASAPPPAAVPDVAPPAPPSPPPPPLVGNDPGPVPAFLDRTGTASAAAPPPPLPGAPPIAPAAVAPPPPPAAPPAPPSPPAHVPSALAIKLVDELKRRAAGNADTGKELAAWLSQPQVGLVMAGANFEEACAVVQFTTDDKIAPVAAMFGIQ